VRRFAAQALAGAVLLLLMSSHAQSFTYGQLVAGSVKASVAYDSGSSSNANQHYSLDGQDILTFTSASDGTIHFKQRGIYPVSVNSPVFTDFAQTYNASTDQLTVTFSVVFPNCTLPIMAIYDAP